MLGRSGVSVSAIGLGGNTFGGAGCDERQTAAIVQRALELGINHFDCADTYGAGRTVRKKSATWARRWPGSETTSSSPPRPASHSGSGPNADGVSRRRIINNCEASLKRLRAWTMFDIFYLHRPTRAPMWTRVSTR